MIYKVKHGFSYTLPLSGNSIFVGKGTVLKNLKMTYMTYMTYSNALLGKVYNRPYYRFTVYAADYYIELNDYQFEQFIESVTVTGIWHQINES